MKLTKLQENRIKMAVNQKKTDSNITLKYEVPVPIIDIASSMDRFNNMPNKDRFDKAKKYLSNIAKKYNCTIENVSEFTDIDSAIHSDANAFFVCNINGDYDDIIEFVGNEFDQEESDAIDEFQID